MSNFKRAPEVEEIAIGLINQFHPHLKDATDKLDFYYRYGGGVEMSMRKCFRFCLHTWTSTWWY